MRSDIISNSDAKRKVLNHFNYELVSQYNHSISTVTIIVMNKFIYSPNTEYPIWSLVDCA